MRNDTMSLDARIAGALLILLSSLFTIAERSSAQSLSPGVAAVVGLGGIGGELDFTVWRLDIYGRAQVSPETGIRLAGARLKVYGENNSAFYVSAAWGQLRCSETHIGGVPSDCDGNWHGVAGTLAGVEIGSLDSKWSVYVDAGRYFGAEDEPELRDWSFLFGVRLRPRASKK